MADQRGWRGVAAFLLVLSSFAMAWGQEPAPAKPPEQPATIKEVSIYLPYTRLKALFEKDERGVFIPYKKFEEMLKAAQNAAARLEEIKPPVGGLITAVESEATIGRDVVLVKATVSIEVLEKGWVRIPLRLADSAIRSAKIGEEPARIISSDAGYELLYEKKGDKPESIELALEYSKAFTKSPGNNHVSFQAPQAAVNRWTIRIAESGVKVNVRPQVATTDMLAKPAEDKPAEEKPEDPKPEEVKETRVEAHIGAAPEITLDWTPKAEGAAGLAALATVQTRQNVQIEEGVVRSKVALVYDITRSELAQLKLEVPKQFKVVNVFDANVQKWEVADKEGDEATQVVTVQLFQPAKGQQSLTMELELVDQDLVKNGVQVPAIKAVEAARQFGIVAIRVASALRAEVTTRTGLAQLDANELPPELANEPSAFAFRYSALPYELALSLQTVEPRIDAVEFVETYLEPRQITIDYLASLTVERTGIFTVDVEIPVGYEVRSVTSRPFADVQGAVIESFYVDPKKATRLTVNFGRKALGKVAFLVQLVKRLDDAALITPGGKVLEKVSLPRLSHKALERAQGHAVIYAPEALQVSASDQADLRSVAPSEALAQALSVRDGRFPGLRETMAFAFFRATPALSLDIERRKPQVAVRQTLTAMIESGVVHFTSTLNYEIQYSGVKSLRVDVPEDLVEELRRQHSGITVPAPQPKDVAKGYKALELTTDGEMLGQVAFPFTWNKTIGELQVGVPKQIAIPKLLPKTDASSGAAIEHAWGQIVVGKAETIDVDGTVKELRPIDPQIDLVDKNALPNAARAFEFHQEDWSLTLTATRYELDDVKRTSIDRALVRVIATRSGQLSVQAIYRLRSAEQRIPIRLPSLADRSAAFDTQPLHVNGQAMPLEYEGDNLLVPLTNRRPDEPVLVELRYTMPGTAGDIELPSFEQVAEPGQPRKPSPAIQKVYEAVYLPQEHVVVGARGPWNDEMPWHPPPFLVALGIVPAPETTNQSDERLLAWVTEGLSISSHPSSRFPTDGVVRIFSTLRPPPGDEGALRLSVWNRNTLKSLVFALVLLIGAGLTARPVTDRIAALGLLLAAVFLAAVFQPSLAGALLEGPLVAAIALVLLIWFVRYVVWLVRNASTFMPPRPIAASPFATVPEAPLADSSSTETQGGKA